MSATWTGPDGAEHGLSTFVDVPVLADKHDRDPAQTATVLQSYSPLGAYDYDVEDVQPLTEGPGGYDHAIDATAHGDDDIER